jgi:hypothetical protein
VNREVHARNCGSRRARFPPATRRSGAALGRDGIQLLSRILLRSKEKLALPYIDRLMVLVVTWNHAVG